MYRYYFNKTCFPGPPGGGASRVRIPEQALLGGADPAPLPAPQRRQLQEQQVRQL